jgi:PKD repeat protein
MYSNHSTHKALIDTNKFILIISICVLINTVLSNIISANIICNLNASNSNLESQTIYIPGNVEGTTFKADVAGLYKFTITGGAYEDCPPDCQISYDSQENWRTILHLFKNRDIDWGNNVPTNSDFVIGDGNEQLTPELAEQIGIGSNISIYLKANDYINLIASDCRYCYGDNLGGINISVEADSSDAEIVVHAVNPEGIEIASIKGMNPNCVGIFADDLLIGYSPSDTSSYNKPLAIEAGQHTIKALFNGIELTQEIVLEKGEKKNVVFIFPRTQFDVRPYIYECNLHSAISGSWFGQKDLDDATDYHPTMNWRTNSHFVNPTNCGDPVMRGNYEGEADLQFHFIDTNYTWSYRCYYNIYIYDGGGCAISYGGNSSIETNSGVKEMPSANSNFNEWFLQYYHVGEVEFTISNHILEGMNMVTLNAAENSTIQIILNKDNPTIAITGENWNTVNSYKETHSWQTFEEQGSGSLKLEISSVPYDFESTGISSDFKCSVPDVDFMYTDVGEVENNKWSIKYAFTDKSSVGEGQTITGWDWDFGDGSEHSSEQNPGHPYIQGGNYDVSLTIQNSCGYSNTKTIINCINDLGYRPNPDGWSFSNSDTNMWPFLWWSRFNYGEDRFIKDPNWLRFFDILDNTYPVPVRFPDWDLFVAAYGESYCYSYGSNTKTIEFSALSKWYYSSIKPWSGSCYGFAITSRLFFDGSLKLNETFPGHSSLYSVEPPGHNYDLARNLINKYQISPQYDKLTDDFDDIINIIQNGLSSFLIGINGTSYDIDGKFNIVHHALAPYKIEKNDNDVIKIYVYDCNHPNETLYISANLKDRTFSYSGVNWLTLEEMKVLPITGLNQKLKTKSTKNDEYIRDYLNIYCSDSNDIIFSHNNESLGFKEDDLIKASFGEAIINSYSGIYRPNAYFLFNDTFDISLSNFESINTSLYISNNNISFIYQRNDAELDQTDSIKFVNNTLTIYNPDKENKRITVTLIVTDGNNEESYIFKDFAISAGCRLSFSADDSIRVYNDCQVKTVYDVDIGILNNTSVGFFKQDSIVLTDQSVHLLVPDSSNGVLIFVDNGNDGIINDTIELFTGTIDDIKYSDDIAMFPNPSRNNISILINEAIGGKVEIKIYSMAGMLVKTVHFYKAKNSYTYNFDVQDLEKGMYIVEISLNENKTIKKLIIK